MSARTLCRLDDLPDPGGKGFTLDRPGGRDIFIVRRGGRVFGYVNSCPHVGTTLDWQPDTFLSSDQRFIQCSTHGAQFEIATGHCVAGPCKGDRLERVALALERGAVVVKE
ncbi:MAG: Rieske (2Fe-2S) protein [Pseudomonadota bacterium]